ncbi:MAG: hypothetical protein AAF420_10255, partial [Pseudomonadota bacterium]
MNFKKINVFGKIFSSLPNFRVSIKLLVSGLALVGVLSCLLLSGIAAYSNSRMQASQVELLNTVTVQKEVENLFNAMTRFSDRQLSVFAAKSESQLGTLDNREPLEHRFNQSVANLREQLQSQQDMLAAVKQADNAYQAFLLADQSLLVDTRRMLTVEKEAAAGVLTSQGAIRELIELAQEVAKKANASTHVQKERIVEGLANGGTFASLQLSEDINNYFTSKETVIVELISKVEVNLVSIESLIGQMHTAPDIDRLLELHDNKIVPLISSTKR